MSNDAPKNPPAEVVSPCISVCQLDPGTGYCIGCWRTKDEIRDWGRASTPERLAILDQLRTRRMASGKISPRDIRPRRRRSAPSAG